MLVVVVVVLENPDRFAIRLTEQISSIGLFAVTESQCTEDEHEDDSKFRDLGLRASHQGHKGHQGNIKVVRTTDSQFQPLS